MPPIQAAIAEEMAGPIRESRKGDAGMHANLKAKDEMCKLLCLFGLFFLFLHSVAAQEAPAGGQEKGEKKEEEKKPSLPDNLSVLDVFTGASYVHLSGTLPTSAPSSLYGGVFSATYYPAAWFGAVAQYGMYAGRGGMAQNMMWGPRVVLHRDARFVPFAQVLAGYVWSNDVVNGSAGTSSAATIQNFAASVGGGLDMNLAKHISIRLADIDYMLWRQPVPPGFITKASTQNDFRYSGGIIFRFYRPKSAR